jgi:tagatose 6-phosphate kinase
MILTVTLNVSIDKLYRIDELKPGEVMRVREARYTAGGKGLNVTKTAQIAGAVVLATGFVGGHAGAFVLEQLQKKGIDNDFIQVDGETRSCINIIEEGSGRQTEFLEPGFTVTAENITSFLSKYDELLNQAYVVTISGSVPAGCSDTIYSDLISRAKAKGKKVILDSSGKLLAQGLQAQPTLIKPNRDEIAALTGTRTTDYTQLVKYAQKLQKCGIEYVVVSLGKEGALMVSEEGVFRGITPDVPVVNTVGCGDAMVAALAVGFERGYKSAELLRFGLAVSTANALTMETGFFRQEDVAWLLELCKISVL